MIVGEKVEEKEMKEIDFEGEKNEFLNDFIEKIDKIYYFREKLQARNSGRFTEI